MSKLFDSTSINSMSLPNRFVRSATWEGLATLDGEVTSELIDMMVTLVEGGVGLIITGHTYVLKEGQAGPGQLAINDDKYIPGLLQMSEAVHSKGGKILMQLAHAGKASREKYTGAAPMVVSSEDDEGPVNGQVITPEYVRKLTNAFAEGAMRAKEAGFDGVQIHAAHGYLVSQFLSPAYNHRQDQYGGDIENRSRVLREVYQAVREVVGKDYPVLIKLNCQDFLENGLRLEDSLWVAKQMELAGLDAVELSGGVLTGGKLSPSRTGRNSDQDEAYYLSEVKRFKQTINIPIILVGGLRSFEACEAVVNDGISDYIAMSRPLIKEPGLIKRWESGEHCKAGCKSDNRCFRTAMSGGVRCDVKD